MIIGKTPPPTVAVVDLQFGSTGKGLMSAYLGLTGRYDTAVTNWGPNAGHTAVYDTGRKVVRTMLANSAYMSPVDRVLIGPGSALNLRALRDEVIETINARLEALDNKLRVYIHEHAAVVSDGHRDSEKVHNRIGSTQKGTAAAYIEKMMRDPDSRCLAKHHKPLIEMLHPCIHVVRHEDYMALLRFAKGIIIEGCQGYSLGINSGFWPYTTSRECTLPQLLADTCVPPRWVSEVIGCMRAHPIRVANRDGAKSPLDPGFSGPCYNDQREVSFEEIGAPQEYTTVTNLPRRVFSFSQTQVALAVEANGCTSIFANFLNYMPQEYRPLFLETVRQATGINPTYHGLGPKVTDVYRVEA